MKLYNVNAWNGESYLEESYTETFLIAANTEEEAVNYVYNMLKTEKYNPYEFDFKKENIEACEFKYTDNDYLLKIQDNNNLIVNRNILIYAFRYSLGRSSYAPSMVINNIKSNIKNIDANDIVLYIKEINECKYYGDEIDKKCWLDFKIYLQDILSTRIK